MIVDSVGENGINKSADVNTVKNRLVQLGFLQKSTDSSTVDVELIERIKLFQSIIRGNSSISGDGKVDSMGYTHQWLNANNAPVWTQLGDGSTVNKVLGYYNSTKDEMDYYGTDWLISTIVKAAAIYSQNYLNSNVDASVMWVNDLSLSTGGSYPPHGTHQTGLDVDVRLPKTNGESGGITIASDEYDREATREMLKAFKSCELVKSILFNDSVLIGESLCSYYTGHDNHFHVKIEPPSMGELLSIIIPISSSLDDSKYT
ncbi:MAG: penicillin-insensitive murein endopeptidase [Saprospiraceae bacterium]|nr:penicillin-insensitive murein endopeptidase [Saprospiraceae bacterium]